MPFWDYVKRGKDAVLGVVSNAINTVIDKVKSYVRPKRQIEDKAKPVEKPKKVVYSVAVDFKILHGGDGGATYHDMHPMGMIGDKIYYRNVRVHDKQYLQKPRTYLDYELLRAKNVPLRPFPHSIFKEISYLNNSNFDIDKVVLDLARSWDSTIKMYGKIVIWYDYRVVDKKEIDNTPLERLPLNRKTLTYDRFGADDWKRVISKGVKGQCGIDAICSRFAGDLAKKYKLVSWFKDDNLKLRQFIGQEYERLYDEKWDGETTCAYIIKRWCEEVGVSCYIVTENEEMICNYQADNWKNICLAGFIADNHFYPINDVGRVAHMRELAKKVDESCDTLNVPIYKIPKHEPKSMFNWDEANKHLNIISHEVTNEWIWEVINKKHSKHTCYVIIYLEDFERFHNWALDTLKVVVYADRSARVLYGRPSSKNTVRVIASLHYYDIKRFLDKRGFRFDDHWTTSTMTEVLFHESAKQNNGAWDSSLYVRADAIKYANKLADQFKLNDLSAGHDTTMTINGDQIYKLWLSQRRCSASSRYVYLSDHVGPEAAAYLDKIHSKHGYTLENCRLVSHFDAISRNDVPFHVYRDTNGYLPKIMSSYSNETMNEMVSQFDHGFTKYAKKERALIGRFDDITNEDNAVAVDVHRCYATCMYQSYIGNVPMSEYVVDGQQKYFQWPVYTAYDKPREYSGEIRTGRYFAKFKNPVYGFDNGWYSEPEIWYLANKTKIEFEITHEWIPSERLPYFLFREFIKRVRLEFSSDVSKFMINMISGMLGAHMKSRDNVYVTESIDLAAYYYYRQGDPNSSKLIKSDDEEFPIYTVRTKKEQFLQSNALPIYNQIIGMGKIRLYHLTQQLLAIGPSKLIQWKVDCAVVEYVSSKHKAEAKKLGDAGIGYRNESGFRLFYNKVPEQQLLAREEYKTRPSKWIEEENHGQLYDHLMRSGIPDKIKEQLKSSPKMDEGCAIEGMPGTGKSTVLAEIYRFHLEAGRKPLILCYTNQATQRFISMGLNAKTFHRGLFINAVTNKSRRIQTNVDVLIIDEISMVPAELLEIVLASKRANNLIVYSGGDWNQLEPVASSISIEYIKDSDVYGDLVGWRKFTLTENIRSDNEMFDILKKILSGQDLKEWLESRRIPYKSMINLCYTNKKRIELNDEIANLWIKQVGGKAENFTFRENGGGNEIIDKVYPLVPLSKTYAMPFIVTAGCDKNNLVKGSKYYLHSWDDENVTLFDAEEPITISKKIFTSHMTLAFAITVHKSQGSTIQEKYVLHEVGQYSWRMLYVALSRTVSVDNVYIA